MKRFARGTLLRVLGSVVRDNHAKIVFYHDIGQSNTVMGTDECLFWSHMEMAKLHGWRFAKYGDVPTRKSLMICFDDGFRGVWERRERLRMAGICPLISVAIRLVGEKGYLTWDEIRILHNEYSFSFASHTWSHQTLTGMMISESPQEQRTEDWFVRELRESREVLSQKLQDEVNVLCFPVGLFNDCVVTKGRAFGYTTFLSSIPGIWTQDSVKCRNLVQNYSVTEFSAVLEGALLPLAARYRRRHICNEI